MSDRKPKIFPLGDSALTVEFGSKISTETNDFVLRLADQIEKNSFPGYLENVPAYSSLTLFYDAIEVRKNLAGANTAYEKVSNFVAEAIAESDEISASPTTRLVEIPICFDDEFSPDLKFVASINSLSAEKVIELFLQNTYRVFMLGFLPGFAYMGEIDERLAAPRQSSPRLNVAAGSVGIAGRQTGIYSLDSPGGWQIIGRTPLATFTPEQETPTLLHPGDEVRFYRIDKSEFLNLVPK